MSRLTQEEQYSLMSLFTIFRSPLMFGGDLPSNDGFTLSLLTNKEVLRMHKETTDVQQLFQENNKVAITSRNPKTHEVYLALFNIDDEKDQKITVNLKDLGLNGDCNVVNLWTGESLGVVSNEFYQKFAPHASGLYKFTE